MPPTTLNGFDLYYESGGDGPPLTFIHGGFPCLMTRLNASDTSSGGWRDDADAWEWDFARHFYFTWYDRRGCHRSSVPDSGYDLENQVKDLEALLDHLGIDATHIVGSSAGGPIAQLFAATRPQRVRSLVLVGTGVDLFPDDDPMTQLVKELDRIFRTQGPEAMMRARPEGTEAAFYFLYEQEEMKARGTLDAYLERHHTLVAQTKQIPEAERLRYYLVELQGNMAYVNLDLAPLTRTITAPTLVLHGSNDQVVPLDWARTLAETIPDARLHVVEGGPHGMLFRNAAARQIAIDFLLGA